LKARFGTAGWSIPAASAAMFPGDGTHLERYAAVMDCVEINSSFYRPHRVQTYERWAASTPASFRFAVKLPKAITHEARLKEADARLAQFVADASGLGDKWAVALVQLPPSLAFDAGVAGAFFARLREAFNGAIVCEPRHRSWFTPEAEQALLDSQVARAAADPARFPAAAEPGGWLGLRYYRWHGSPRTYWSAYDEAWLRERAQALQALPARAQAWCVFDNTAAGAALPNALQLRTLVDS
jgi:uncharacterized protein YecE (DUF72 family)